MNIIFCRHGETEFNLFDRFQGVSDSPLTEKGEGQAKNLNHFLKKYSVEKFFISPLGRVKQTYDLASIEINATVIIIPELRELCYGDWETKRRGELNPFLLELKARDKFNYVHPGSYNNIPGESYKMQFDRVLPFLKSLEETKENNDIVVIAHQGILLEVYKYFNHLDDKKVSNFKNSNHQVIIISIEGDQRTVSLMEIG